MRNVSSSKILWVFALSNLLLTSCVGPEVPSSPSSSEQSELTTEPSIDSKDPSTDSKSEESSSDPTSSKAPSDESSDSTSIKSSDSWESSDPYLPSSDSSSSLEPVEHEVYRIEFGEAKYSDSDTLSESCFTSDGIDVSLGSVANCYSAGVGNAVRVGSAKNKGNFTLNFNGDIAPDAIRVYSYAYEGEYKITLTLDGNEETSPALSPTAFDGTPSYEVAWGRSLKSLNVAGDTRFCFVALDLVFGKGYVPPVSSSHSSSSSESSSSSGPSSSSDSSSWEAGNIDAYYASVNLDLSGALLKSALFKRISNPYDAHSYDYAYTAYLTTDTGSDGKIIDMYSSIKFDPVTDYQGAPGKGNYKKEGDMFNREHTIPQSVFNERAPMKSDLHHLLPTDGYVNNRRSNYPHAYVSNVKYTSTNGTIVGTGDARNHGYSGNACEPIDEYKGDFARIYFYFVTRYENLLSGWGNFSSFSKNTYPSLSKWAIETYLEWNDLDPVSEKEIARNEAVYAIQKNRNPFVDIPGLAHRIWDEAL